jgi:hypothetical protein
MSKEYLSRRQFIRRVTIGGAVAAIGATDFSYINRQRDEAAKEVIEQGVTPPAQDKKILQSKDEKAQQAVFDKAVQKRLDEKINLPNLRNAADTVAVVGGLFVVFNTMLRKNPSWGPNREC